MRATQPARALLLLFCGLSAPACAKLIGLDDLGSTGSTGGEAGETQASGGESQLGGSGPGRTGGTSSSGNSGGGSPGAGGSGGSETGGRESSGGDAGESSGGAAGSSVGGTSSGGSSGGDVGSGGTGGAEGGTGSSGGSGGATGGGGTGGSGGPDCATDGFSDAAKTSSCWTLFGAGTLFGGTYSQDETNGVVVFRPDAGHSWYEGDSAAFLYQGVVGDFVFEVEVRVFQGATAQTSEQPPTGNYITGGIVAYPYPGIGYPDLNAPGPDGHEGYYAVKAGSLAGGLTGVKSEVTWLGNGSAPVTSKGEVEGIDPSSSVFLRLCRYQSLVITAYRTDAEADWTPFHAARSGYDFTNGYDTSEPEVPGLPEYVNIGVASEAWDTTISDGSVRVVFDFAELRSIESLDDCLAMTLTGG